MIDTRSTHAFWAHLHALGVLAECGSYTAAAQRLAISKAAMSQRISELERAAGLPLVRRTTRSVRLTEAGQQLADATRDAYQQIERSFVGVKDMAGEPRGLLRVTAPVALGRQQVVPRLAAFLRQYADIRIELELGDRLVPLAQEGFDLAIRHTATPPDTHVAWALCETRSVLVASRAYLRRRGTPERPSDLATHECLHYLRPGESPVWRFEPERISRDRPEPVSVAIRGCFGANNSEVLREAVMDGLGLAILPDFSAQHEIATGRLVVVLPQWRSVDTFGAQIYAMRPHSPHVPRAVQALVAHLREHLKQGFGAD